MNRKAYLVKIFSFGELFGFKLIDLLRVLSNSKYIKRLSILRDFSFLLGFEVFENSKRGFYKIKLKLNQSEFKITLRRKTSDIAVYYQVLQKQEYAFVIPYLESLKKENVFIVDAGSNIGLTIIYFKAFFPKSKIIGLEPEPMNFKVLEENIKQNNLNGIQLINKGLYNKSDYLYSDYNFRDGESWSFSLKEKGSNEKDKVETVTIQDIYKYETFNVIDFLKIDIEGCEAVLLRDSNFLNFIQEKVRFIAIEVHQEYIPNREVYQTLKEMKFFMFPIGDFSFGVNENFVLRV